MNNSVPPPLTLTTNVLWNYLCEATLKVGGLVAVNPLKLQMEVSKNRGTPKWMVCNGKPYKNG